MFYKHHSSSRTLLTYFFALVFFICFFYFFFRFAFVYLHVPSLKLISMFKETKHILFLAPGLRGIDKID